MNTSEFKQIIRSTILDNISVGTVAEIEVRRFNKPLGFITGAKYDDYKVRLHDSKYSKNKMKVIDLLALLDRVAIRGRRDKTVVYSKGPMDEYDIKSVYFRLDRNGYQIKYCKFIIHVN